MHSVHRVVPVVREPSADLAVEAWFLHRSVWRPKSQQVNNLWQDHHPVHSTLSRRQWAQSVAEKSSDQLDSAASRYYKVLVRELPQTELRSALETGKCCKIKTIITAWARTTAKQFYNEQWHIVKHLTVDFKLHGLNLYYHASPLKS